MELNILGVMEGDFAKKSEFGCQKQHIKSITLPCGAKFFAPHFIPKFCFKFVSGAYFEKYRS